VNVDPYADLDIPDDLDELDDLGLKAPRRRIAIASRILDRSQLADLPTPSPLIDRTIDLGTVALLAGYFGSLKSFIALDWAASVATGRRWQGRATEQRRVLYIAAEGAYGLHQRLDAWETGWGVEIPPAALNVFPGPVHLGNALDVYELCTVARDHQYGVVVVDTLAKSIAGMDENSAQDMGRAVESLYRIQAATHGGTVIAVHHTGKDKTTIRGSSALESGVDTVYTTEGDSSLVKLTRTKRKDGPAEDVHHLSFAAVSGTASGVIQSQRGSETTPSARDFLSHFESHFAATGATTAQLRDTADMPRASFYRALSALVSTGDLTNTGTDKRPFYVLEER
jgi:hypothetical protein